MTDPRFTDPRSSDPRLSDPVIRRDESVGGMWGWIAGVAVLLLIGFLIVAGWNNNGSTASNGSSPVTTSSAPAAQRGPADNNRLGLSGLPTMAPAPSTTPPPRAARSNALSVSRKT